MCSICKTIFLAGIFLVQIPSAVSQTRDSAATREYDVNYWISVPLIGVGALTNSHGLRRIRDREWYQPGDIDALDRSKVPSFDRIALRQDLSRYKRAESFSDIGITWGTLLPATLILADRRMRHDWLDIAVTYIETQTVLSNFYAWSFLGPTLIERHRPITYYADVDLEERLWGGNRNSFYSGHVAVTAVTTFFMAQSWLDYHPGDRNLRWLLYGLATIPPAFIGVKRVQALKHFPSDIVSGLIIGAAGGIFWPKLHQGRLHKRLSMSLVSQSDWAGMHLRWTFGGGAYE